MTDASTTTPCQADYWNADGGRRWLLNLQRTEDMLVPIVGRLLEAAAPRPGESVIEVGCGGGRVAARIAACVQPGGSVLAVDVSAPILDEARKLHGNVPGLTFLRGDAGVIDLGRHRFDLICSRFGVMFFSDPVAAFTNLHRAMKPDGRLAFICWRDRDENPWMCMPAMAVFQILPPPPPPNPGDPGPFAFADETRVRSILARAGFRHVRFEAVDGEQNMGTLDEAVNYLTTMGPAAQPLAEAEPELAARAAMAMREVLAEHETAGRVRMSCATWCVTARASA